MFHYVIHCTYCTISDQRRMSLSDREVTTPWGWTYKKKDFEMSLHGCHLHCLPMYGLGCLIGGLPDRMAVGQCYCHKTKKLGFNGLASPHEGRVPAGFKLGTVEVVFDQLVSAWLGVNRWTNYTHVRICSLCFGQLDHYNETHTQTQTQKDKHYQHPLIL